MVEQLVNLFGKIKVAYYELNLIKKESSIKDDDFDNIELKRDPNCIATYLQIRCGHNGALNYIELLALKDAIQFERL